MHMGATADGTDVKPVNMSSSDIALGHTAVRWKVSLTSISLRQFFGIYNREQGRSNRIGATANDVHLCQCVGGDQRFEYPEYPGHECRNVDVELLGLSRGHG